jgi:hypothetical protein
MGPELGGRFVGDFEGGEDNMNDKDTPDSIHRVARRIASNAKRACSPRFLTLVTVAPPPPPVLAFAVVEAFAALEAGAYALRAARMCEGETAVIVALRGFDVESEVIAGTATALSIPPRSTSNKALTSPVMPDTFFVNNVRVDWGRNRRASSLSSPSQTGANRD